MSRSAYWTLTTLLIVFGFITGFSIGAPFFILGLVLAVLGPVRHYRRVFWPAVSAVVAATVGYVLFAPLSCTASGVVGGALTTVCSSILGGPSTGGDGFNPSLEPGLRAAAVYAVVAAMAAWIGLSPEIRRRWSPSA